MGKLALLVIDYSYAGGVERVTSLLAELFSSNGFPLEYIISLKSEFERPLLSYPPAVKKKILFPGNKIEDFEKELTDFLISENVRTLIFQGDNLGISFRILAAASKAGCKAVLHYHGSAYGYLRKYIYRKDIQTNWFNIVKLCWDKMAFPLKKARLKKLILECKDGFVCVSDGARQEIINLYSFTKDENQKIISIHNPLTFGEIVIDYNKKENIVIYISRLERRHKNSMLVLEAWKILHLKFLNWKLQILGHGSKMEEMQQYCTDNGLQNVEFKGVVDNVETYLRKSSISILTSDCEGLGMGMMESAAFGNALVSTRSNGGITDTIVNEVSGFLVPRNDAGELANKIEYLINHPVQRKIMAEAAAKKVFTFSDNRILEQWAKILAC